MLTVRTALVAILSLGFAASAIAQSRQGNQPPTPPQRPPVLIDPYNRGPPRPPERAWPTPRSEVAPPRERTPQVAPLAPRIGN